MLKSLPVHSGRDPLNEPENAPNPLAGLETRSVSLSEFPWRFVPAHRYGNAVADLLEIVLEDGPAGAGAFARALEGIETACFQRVKFGEEDRSRLAGLLERLKHSASQAGCSAYAEWLVWCVEAFQAAVDRSTGITRPEAETLLFLRAGRLAAESFYAGQTIDKYRQNTPGFEPLNPTSLN